MAIQTALTPQPFTRKHISEVLAPRRRTRVQVFSPVVIQVSVLRAAFSICCN